MSSFHHTAYEANLMGIDPDGKIHLSEKVSETTDGPMFDYGLLRLEGKMMRLPKFSGHHPNREYLAAKHEEFQKQS